MYTVFTMLRHGGSNCSTNKVYFLNVGHLQSQMRIILKQLLESILRLHYRLATPHSISHKKTRV